MHKTPAQKSATSNRHGFTILETIVAFAVMLGALAGPLTLIIFALPRAAAAKNKIIALHLAQEGIELVRLIRDNNVLCDYLDGNPQESWPWTSNPQTGGTGHGAQFANADYRISAFDTQDKTCGGATVIQPRPEPGSPNLLLRLDPASGFYQYDTGPEMIFKRRITIQTGAGVANPDAGITPENQMDIVARVSWTERNQTKAIELRERLYNWR
ncbi:MAG: hypothetical protein AAB539_02505 [Patescibacteria group bacterium]